MGKTFQNSFNAGVWDEKLHGRPDIERYSDGMRQGTNVLLRPQGGAYRRPGLKYLATLPGQSRLLRFLFSRDQQYLLVLSNLLLEIYEDEAKITQVVAPWTAAQAQELNRTQSADTMVLLHEDVSPRRLLRSALSDDPITTDGSTTTVRVGHPAHGLADGTKLGLSGIDAAVGGVPVAELNTNHTIATIDGSLGANPVTTTNSSKNVVVAISGHEFVIGERVEFSGVASVNGIPASDINRIVTVTAISAGVSVTFVAANAATSSGSGGGSLGEWSDPDRYEITVTTTSTSAASGGGTAGRAWSLSDLSDTTGAVFLDNLPQFDFQDESSPGPADEVQKVQFGGTWSNGDKYRLSLDGKRTGTITYTTDDVTKNASEMQDALRALSRFRRFLNSAFDIDESIGASELVVEYDSDSAGPGGGDDYIITFTGIDGKKNWATVAVEVRESASGTLTAVEVTEGGSQKEDVISTTRGWPSAGTFYQGRLWLVGLKSRPRTVIASKSQDQWDFYIGDALDGDGIDATGVTDPILHIVDDRELFILTARGEVVLGGDGEKPITPTNIRFSVNNRYGSTAVAPISVGGRPLYVDRTNRNIRQFSYSLDTDNYESAEVSIFSQQLITTPTDMDGLRNSDGDYCFAVMSDGTIAALIVNTDQGVMGWTKLTTGGVIENVAAVADEAYCVVLRTINAASVRYLEKFDAAFFTDSGKQATDTAATAWSGLSHLEGETVQVRGDEMTLDDETVTSGAITSSEAVDDCEVGLAFIPTIQPLPPMVSRYTRVVATEVDLLNSRAVLVNGFKIKDRQSWRSGLFTNPPALLSGLQRMTGRGWGERKSPVITQTEPQPMEVRGVIMEVV